MAPGDVLRRGELKKKRGFPEEVEILRRGDLKKGRLPTATAVTASPVFNGPVKAWGGWAGWANWVRWADELAGLVELVGFAWVAGRVFVPLWKRALMFFAFCLMFLSCDFF